MSKDSIKVIIVDDEKPAREELRHLLDECPEISVVGSARDCIETEKLLLENHIELIFMDIQMPGLNGMELARKILNQKPQMQFIFTTAYDKFAVEAFDIHAVDYLLKPIRLNNLKRSIQRGITHLKEDKKDKQSNLEDIIDSYLSKNNKNNTKFVSVYHGDKIIPIKIDNILYAEARGRFVWIITDNNEYKTNNNFTNIEEVLLEPNFFVCHRSYIININKIESIELSVNSSYQIRLTGSKNLIPVSRNRKDRLQNLLSI